MTSHSEGQSWAHTDALTSELSAGDVLLAFWMAPAIDKHTVVPRLCAHSCLSRDVVSTQSVLGQGQSHRYPGVSTHSDLSALSAWDSAAGSGNSFDPLQPSFLPRLSRESSPMGQS